ncbi:MAG: hypothetical protein CVU62_01675 [Deltaproteobacteria bacterium HGW-Deltaproteobacteria-2]|nr:MAG: hypothetical protein CVU62_01675 [Deltaproteobacteria bacterium HGW-Deltaproteobacteria-2]
MKKILLLTVIALFVMMPFASFAKTAITDSELSSVTAQEGVTIDFGTSFSLGNVQIETISWGDGNGFTGYASAGWVGASVDMSPDAVTMSGTLNIDVGTNTTDARTAVAIKLPNINISGNITSVLKLAPDQELIAAGNATIGTAFIKGLTLSPAGTLVIYAH